MGQSSYSPYMSMVWEPMIWVSRLPSRGRPSSHSLLLDSWHRLPISSRAKRSSAVRAVGFRTWAGRMWGSWLGVGCWLGFRACYQVMGFRLAYRSWIPGSLRGGTEPARTDRHIIEGNRRHTMIHGKVGCNAIMHVSLCVDTNK